MVTTPRAQKAQKRSCYNDQLRIWGQEWGHSGNWRCGHGGAKRRQWAGEARSTGQAKAFGFQPRPRWRPTARIQHSRATEGRQGGRECDPTQCCPRRSTCTHIWWAQRTSALFDQASSQTLRIMRGQWGVCGTRKRSPTCTPVCVCVCCWPSDHGPSAPHAGGGRCTPFVQCCHRSPHAQRAYRRASGSRLGSDARRSRDWDAGSAWGRNEGPGALRSQQFQRTRDTLAR